MKNKILNKFFAPLFILVALLLSFNVHSLNRTGSIERLINACEQELQTICARLNEPGEAVMCLIENEPQLQTQKCFEEVQLIRQESYYVPQPTEEPFLSPDATEIK